MLAKISTRLELLFLDMFIYVLSDARWFRMLVRGFYALKYNRQLHRRLIGLCVLFGLLGVGLGWVLSVFLNGPALPGIF